MHDATLKELKNILESLRKKLYKYLLATDVKAKSVHINSIEIALCLAEFSIETNPHRPISKEEEKWFNAGYFIDMILRNSEWADIADLYYSMAEGVEKINYFRG